MNLSPLWVPFLGSHGFETVHWSIGSDALRACAAYLEAAALVTVDTNRNRIRLLPIEPSQ